MGDTFEIEDASQQIRITGPIVDPGATAGDVLTVNTDKSISAKGGSLPVTALSGSGSPVGVAAATAIGQLYIDTGAGALWIAANTGTDHWQSVGGLQEASAANGISLSADSPIYEVVDSNGASAFYIDDPTDSGTTDAVTRTAGNTLDDGTEAHNMILPNMPTSDPGIAGALFSTAGVVHVSAG